jgi:GNAT superfamily N-acetyltransferase
MLKIRRYQDADREAVWALHNAALLEVGAHPGSGEWDTDLRDIPGEYFDRGGEFLVGELDGEVVAMGGIRPLEDGTMVIRKMRIRPDCQRRGYGRAILEALHIFARSRGARKLTLHTTVRQTPAHALYRSFGYREIDRTQIYGFECIHFEKLL